VLKKREQTRRNHDDKFLVDLNQHGAKLSEKAGRVILNRKEPRRAVERERKVPHGLAGQVGEIGRRG
jgi:hypothetical protein